MTTARITLAGESCAWRQDAINNQWTIERLTRCNGRHAKLWMLDIRGQTRPGERFGLDHSHPAMVFQFLTPDGKRPAHGRHHYLWWPFPTNVIGVYTFCLSTQRRTGWVTLSDIEDYIMEETL